MSLVNFESKKYSQNGEDGIIEYLINLIYQDPKNKIYLEIGVQDGTECNTRNLRENFSWTGILIDGDHEDKNINLFSHFVTKDNIIELLKSHDVSEKLNLLSIDIDYNDFYVLIEILKKYKSDIVVLEYNATHSYEEDKIVLYDGNGGWDGTNYFGASLLSYTKLLNKFGYSLVSTESKGVNAFFISNDFISNDFILSNLKNVNSLKDLYNSAKYGNGPNGGHPPDSRNREYLSFNETI
jgi:hypothetical protein